MKSPSGEAAFLSRYAAIYAQRWPALKRALLAAGLRLDWDRGLSKPYSLDPASVLAALALPPLEEGEAIDLCAAPGGKSLVIAAGLGPNARLTANERSRERSARLRRVLDEHLPVSSRSKLICQTADAAALCRKRPLAYDRILLDAPCSSERHVLASAPHLDKWSPSRVKRLAQDQWALLSSAFLMLKEDGFLVYSTCSIGPEENEGVLSRLSAKYGTQAAFLDPAESMRNSLEAQGEYPQASILRRLLDKAERGERGLMFMPDTGEGSGPLFVSLIAKKGEPARQSRTGSPS
jgi:16S rRNA C967 or C1407 C5-methylase (RsmB/RsmF family)